MSSSANLSDKADQVLMCTSELPEVMMADRVLVLARGRLVGELAHEEIDLHGDAVLNLFH